MKRQQSLVDPVDCHAYAYHFINLDGASCLDAAAKTQSPAGNAQGV